MKEITRIITAQITVIETMPDDDAEDIIKSQEIAKKNIEADLRKMYKADDVTVYLQDFERDI